MYQSDKLLTPEQTARIQADFERMEGRLGKKIPLPSTETPLEKTCLQFLYGAMPLSDIAAYDAGLFLEMIRETLEIWEKTPWRDQISGEMFLNDVLSCRINNENIVLHRKQFFQEISPLIQGMNLHDAALEVNYWCYSQATYQSTNERTLSATGVRKNAFGRCGEESTLLVSALRSVGIPARQCYTHRWAHCDDNHAWVEAWTGDSWHYMGACEPEPVMDRGWFTSAAQRAMLIHARLFSHLTEESEEQVMEESAVMTQLNILDHYTKTKLLTVEALDAQNRPVSGVSVHFQLINYSELASLAILSTDERGRVSLRTGLGDLLLHACKDGKYLERKVDVRRYAEDTVVTLHWEEARDGRDIDGLEAQEIELRAPSLLPVEETVDSPETAALHQKKMARALAVRQAYEATFLQGKRAADFAETFSGAGISDACKLVIAEVIGASNGNHEEIARFLRKGLEQDDLALRARLLVTLEKKDLSDSTADMLEDHIQSAKAYQEKFSNQPDARELYEPYVLCPRVDFEMLTPYRGALMKETASLKEKFTENPMEVWNFVKERVVCRDDLGYGHGRVKLLSFPAETLRFGMGTELSRWVLFVALCRTWGIPARLNPVDRLPEYWDSTGWHVAVDKEKDAVARDCTLILQSVFGQEEAGGWEYRKNVTVARLEQGVFNTLGLDDVLFSNGRATYRLGAGTYRITVSNRMPNGDILATLYMATLKPQETKTVEIALRQEDFVRSQRISLPELFVKKQERRVALSALSDRCRMVACLQEGAEPTEHLLNEMLTQSAAFTAWGKEGRLFFLLRDRKAKENPTLAKVLSSIPVEILLPESENHEGFAALTNELFEELKIPHRKYPLVMVLDENGQCAYESAGYNVGAAETVLKLLAAMK